MNTLRKYQKISAAAVIASLLPLQVMATVVVGNNTQFTDIVSGTQIDPSGGATVSKENANWSTWFHSSGGGTYTAVSKTQFNALTNKFILNFENASGFGTATQTIKSDGTIFSASGSIAPFTTKNDITQITTASDINISVDARTFFHTPTSGNPYLGNENTRSVFLVGDRAANDTMTSGTQGLTVGNYNGSAQAGVGVYLKFDTNLSFFSVTLNNNSSTSGGWAPYIVLFDKAGSVVATYGGSLLSGESAYFGVQIENAEVDSVWIGNKSNGSTANFDGVVIDDIGFSFASQIPEPANIAAILGGLLLCACLISASRKKSTRHSAN